MKSAWVWFAILPVASAHADTSTVIIPENVVSVVTAGYWQTSRGAGTYRVVLIRGGFEHVTSEVIAQWLLEPPGPELAVPRIIASKTLIKDCLCSLEVPHVTASGDKVRVALKGVVTQSPTQRVSCEFLLEPTGDVKVVRACE